MLLFIAFRPSPDENKMFVCGNVPMNDPNDSVFADGKAIFQSHCASCHHPLRDATGPALGDISSFRSREWLCKFVTRPKFKPNDKRAVNLRKQYGLRCMKFPQLNCKDIDALVRFVDYKR